MKDTQLQTVLSYLKEHKNITSWQAITKFRITRLSAVIYILRDEGYNIETRMEKKGKTQWANYHYLGRINNGE